MTSHEKVELGIVKIICVSVCSVASVCDVCIVCLQTSKQSVSVRARKAIQLLHDCFSTRHPRVRGQTMEEVGVVCNPFAASFES